MSSTEPAAAERGGGGAGPTALEALLARDRLVVVSVLAGVIVAAWAWILAGAGMGMDHPMAAGAPGQPYAGMPGRGAPMGSMAAGGIAAGVMAPAGWTPGHALLVFLMWWAMMVGMMLPSAAPVLLLFARVNRKEKAGVARTCRPRSSPRATSPSGPASAPRPPACTGGSSASASCPRR